MKKSRFSEEQMVRVLREADVEPVPGVAKCHGVSEQTISSAVRSPARAREAGCP